MKKYLLTLLCLLLFIKGYSQKIIYIIEENINEYYVGKELYSQVDLLFANVSESTLILWFDKDTVDLSREERIRKYFFSTKGNFSLMGLIWDGHISSFTPSLFESFFKIIRPNDRFIVSVTQKGKIENPKREIDSLTKYVYLVDYKYIRGMEIDQITKLFSYKGENITILKELL